jgi:hypothetical protein
MWKNIVEQGSQNMKNMAHAHCILDTSGYKHALATCNTHCFSTTTTVMPKRFDATLRVYCPLVPTQKL